MQSHPIVIPAPFLDQDLRLPHAREYLRVQKFVPELPIERLVVAVLPRTPRLDEERLYSSITVSSLRGWPPYSLRHR
jgi:hypothetical protein